MRKGTKMIYEYKALSSTAKSVRGIVEADNMENAIQMIRKKGIFPTKINAREKFSKSHFIKDRFKLYSFVPKTTKEKAMFSIICFQIIVIVALLV